MKKYRFEIIIFIAEAICMILELLASRILSPYFGNSNIVWTSVIGIILLSGSIGNYIGGIIADKDKIERNLKITLIITAIFMMFIPILQKYIINFVLEVTQNKKIGAVLCTLLLFFIPSMLMGLLSPIVVKLKLKSLETAGRVSGKIHAIATVGGIVGTFLGGFFLIPNFGSINILCVLTILVLILIPLVDLKLKNLSNVFVVIMIIITIILIAYYTELNNINEKHVLKNNSGQVSYDTQYGRVLIYNSKLKDNGKDVRIFNIDSGYESITYIDEDSIYEPVSEYIKMYDLMFKSNKNINNTLMIGGGGYSYPKYYISHFEDKTMDVVEIDEDVTKLAKQYFYLDKLIEDYNLNENHRLNLITEDGRIYLNENTKKYDAILNDAFSGNSPVKTLTTLEAIKEVKKSLTDNGLYLSNIIGTVDGKNSKFLKTEVNTLRQVFKNVYVIPVPNFLELEIYNNMVIATDDILELDNIYDIEINKNEIILTDDYCPVDTLIPEV